MSWKLYVHIEDDIEATTVIHLDPDQSVSVLVEKFIQWIQNAFPTVPITYDSVTVKTEKGAKLSFSSPLNKTTLKTGSDVFICRNQEHKIKSPPAATTTKEPPPSVDELKQRGNEFLQLKQYRKAIEQYTKAIQLSPKNPVLYSNRAQAYLSIRRYEDALTDAKTVVVLDGSFTKGYFRAGRAAFELKRYSEALEYFERGLKLETKTNSKSASCKEFKKWVEKCSSEAEKPKKSKVISTPSFDAAKLSQLGIENQEDLISKFQQSIAELEKLFAQGKLRQCKQICETILSVIPGEKLSSHYLGTILLSAKRYERALEILKPACEAHPNEIELKFSLAEAYSGTNQHSEALDILRTISKDNDGPLHERVNTKIARSLLRLGKKDMAMQFIVGVLKSNQTNFDALLEYGKLMIENNEIAEAIKVFLKCLIDRSEDEVVRRQLAIAVSKPNGVSTLQDELQEAKFSPSALGFLALIFKDFGAISQSADLFKLASEQAPTNPTYLLNYVHVLEILHVYQKAYEKILSFFSDNPALSLPFHLAEGKLEMRDLLSVLNIERDIYNDYNTRSANADCNFQTLSKVYEPSDQKYPPNLDNDQLDLLAMICTLVKILFVSGGNIELIHQIVKLVEPTRNGRELHTTTIRNEHAYYCCIAQLLDYVKVPLPPFKPLYVMGDSHTLPTAWQTVTIRSESRLLVPKLVTGCKMWHLRPEAYFFPKDNFYSVVETIPDGSEVVFIFGEIDCREGILVAVEKCRYENVEEGIRHTISIFIDVLETLVETRNLVVYVHPVIPVLNETRSMVKQFNAIYEETIKQSKNLHWLGFFDQLLSSDGEQFNSDYALDGTHMNPTYLPLLEEAINNTSNNG